MSDLGDREKGFERKFERDQELEFKIKVRRNRLLGLWAAEKLGLKAEAAGDYARGIADPAKHLHGDEAVIKQIASDFNAKSIAIDEARLRLEITRFAAEATKQLTES
jgi:hypothetical protein